MQYSTVFAAAFLCSAISAQDYRLNELPERGTYVRDFRVTSDGKRVVYLARPRGVGELHLYLVDDVLPIHVEKPRERRLLDGRNVFELELANGRLVYQWYDGATFQVSSLLVDGRSGPVDLGPGLAPRPTPDGRAVVFRRADGLYSVPADGSAPPLRIQSSAPYPVHHQWVLTPDSARVVYVTEGSIRFQGGLGHVYSARLDGSAPPVALNSPAAACGVGNHVVSPDSRWVVFRRVDIARGVGLYRVPIDGSAPAVRLHDALPAGAEVVIFHPYTTPLFTPDSSRVVYRLEQAAPDLTELFSAPLDGSSAPVKLNDEVERFVWMVRLSPDGTRLAYLASAASFDDPSSLFSVPVAGGAPPERLNAALVADGSVVSLRIAPDGGSVVYMAQAERLDRYDLFSVSMDGGPPSRRLNSSDQSVFGAHPDALEFAGEGDSVVYPAVRLGGPPNAVEVFSAAVTGLGTPARLSGPMVSGGSVISLNPFFLNPGDRIFRLAADGTLALFRADQEKNDVFELWAAPVPARPFRRIP